MTVEVAVVAVIKAEVEMLEIVVGMSHEADSHLGAEMGMQAPREPEEERNLLAEVAGATTNCEAWKADGRALETPEAVETVANVGGPLLQTVIVAITEVITILQSDRGQTHLILIDRQTTGVEEEVVVVADDEDAN